MKYRISFRHAAATIVVILIAPGVTPAASSLFSSEKKPFPQVLNPGQTLYMEWSERQFAQLLDQSRYANLPAAEKAQREGQWLAALKKPQTPEYYLAINCLAAIRSRKAVKPLLEIATDRREKDNRDRWMAVRALGILGDESAVPALIPLLYHYDQSTRFWTQITLARLTGVNFGDDWRKWGAWWTIQGKTPRFSAEQVTWTTRADWSDPNQMRANDEKLVEQLQQQAAQRAAQPPAQPAIQQPAPAAGGPPRIVSTTPRVGAKNINPALKEILVVFNQDMARGFSWTGGGELFPKTSGRPYWKDARTCALPVALEPGHAYRLGVNSKSHRNFRSQAGVPVSPIVIYFSTTGGTGDAGTGMDPPRVVMMNPANGATNVSPALTEIRVTFDRPMGGGFSWTGGGERFPETTGRPRWAADRKTCILPVRLKPNWSYRLGLNSRSHINFQSAKGVPLAPVVYRFTTGAQ